jgi:hypothetical protein
VSRFTRAALAGIAGALAYLAAQEVDRRIADPRSNDLVLLGGLVTERRAIWLPLGLAMHLFAGATFGLIFDRFVADRLPGPYWLRGLLMAQAENVALWPIVLLLDRSHTAVKTGDHAPMNRPVYFVQAVWRHAALGSVMGALLARNPATQRQPSSHQESR